MHHTRSHIDLALIFLKAIHHNFEHLFRQLSLSADEFKKYVEVDPHHISYFLHLVVPHTSQVLAHYGKHCLRSESAQFVPIRVSERRANHSTHQSLGVMNSHRFLRHN